MELNFSKNIVQRCKLTEKYWKFTAEVKHLDLEYNGQFETFIYYSSTPMTLLEQASPVVESILNQLEVDNCEHDYTANDIFNIIFDEMKVWGKEAISEFGIHFTYNNGCIGQYYVQFKGTKIVD